MSFKIIDLGILDYLEGYKEMRNIHSKAVESGENYLILCQHYDVYTVGENEKEENFPVPVVKTDRGGSITFHGIGQPIFYFVFRVNSPKIFYRKVVKSFDEVFKSLSDKIYHDFKNPGFYIEKRKLASLGFRYSKGYSLHGVAVNHSVNLEKFNLIKPCNLDGYTATSLIAEGINIDIDNLKNEVIKKLYKNFS
ncbi:lipoyl(octanoyl) transferase LipB [Sulfurihydrogenibium azorense]|jgi:lipoyl(octanoyl) transferase|uniref:Octanoyltransferase n=1 Tax=Sulfurihydrogenibium azorense (strain DSM 15241 / OCM 825 / Az-Fu1) TaxID=204536 RepID=C1DVT0_SULAA|nr:lipoyl(octanoyl) transferase LipB [Sulfurihydrogenibium azorense]ACN99590.1 octanoyltransferase (Octanoyl-[acyl-carrier-protein]-protein N-octanoyltransferase) (Lipoyl/octanoyl transferase) (Lipoate-protein ligase B) [Sulfurihydrogenibium azorense Az-Fu1]MDM7273566.1 lipoyl(octanoyl) transferase LipB [Sulfurihydrogenibium azorense]